jgi:hypothetical protein
MFTRHTPFSILVHQQELSPNYLRDPTHQLQNPSKRMTVKQTFD